jgi:hypothetical protein
VPSPDRFQVPASGISLDKLQKRRDFWRERVGEKAEYWNWCAMRAQLVFSVVQVLIVFLGSAAIVAHKSLGIEVILGELVVLAILVLRAFYRHRFYREASAYVGVKVRWYRPIPIRDKAFAVWQARNGLNGPSAAITGDDRGHLH